MDRMFCLENDLLQGRCSLRELLQRCLPCLLPWLDGSDMDEPCVDRVRYWVDLRLSYRGRISLAWKHAIALVISRGGNYFSFIPLLTISLFWLSFLDFLYSVLAFWWCFL